MRRLFIWLLTFIAILVGLILALPSLFSSDKIWAQVSPILEQQVGRKITVSGTRELSLYPNIALVLGDVEIGSNVSSDMPLANLDELRISVDLMALFSGNINIHELRLNGADIHLLIDAEGKKNWVNGYDEAAQLPEKPTNPDDPLGALIADSVNEQANNGETVGEATEFDLSTLSVKNFKITNSRFTYEDQMNDRSELIENVDVNIQLAKQNKSLSLNGSLMWQRQLIDFDLDSLNIDQLQNENTTDLNFKMNAKPISFDLNGQLRMAEQFGFDGKVAVKSPSIQQASNWLKFDLSDVNDTALDLSSDLKISGNMYQLANLKLAAFASQINGTLNFSNGAKPNVYGKLSIDQINYSKIITASETKPSSSTWSNAPLNLAILSQLNSNIGLEVASLNYDGIIASQLNTSLIIRKSKAKIPLQMNIFGGQISTDITAELNGNAARVSATIDAKNIKAGDALQSLDISDKLTATTNFNSKITSHGASLQQLMNNLSGTGTVDMADGVIKGIALADALAPEIANIDLSLNSPEKLASFALEAGKNLFAQNMTGLMSSHFGQNVGAEKQTHFVKAVMTYQIDQGVLDNQDLEVSSENIIIRGAGKINIGKKTLNYRIIPKLLRKAETGTTERMTIPALITGPWSAPNVAIDYAYAIENSSTIQKARDKAVQKITDKITEKVTDKLVEKVKDKIGDKLGDKVGDELTKQVGDQVGELLGIKPKNDAQPKPLPEEAPKSDGQKLLDAGNLLNNLLNPSQ